MLETFLSLNNGPTPLPKGKWSTLTADTIPRYDHAMAHYNGELFVFGGRGNAGAGILNTIRKYNLATNTWSAIATVLPSARQGLTATTIGNKIYVYGGLNGSTKYGDLYAFDPVTNTLTTLSTGLACNGHAAATYNDELYVFGGQATSSTTPPVNTLRKYNPANNTWVTLTTLGEVPKGRFYAAGGISDGRFYIAGGVRDSSMVVPGMDIYDIASNTWLPSVVLVDTNLAAGGVGVTGRLYVIGGNPAGGTSTVYTDTTRAYNTVLGNWSTLEKYPLIEGYMGCCAVGEVIYGFGGYNPTAVQAGLFRYNP